MYGLLWYDNIWLRYGYLKIWNLRVQTNLNIEKIVFKVVQIILNNVYCLSKIKILYIYGKKCIKYLHGT